MRRLFDKLIDSKYTQRSLLRSQLEILSEPDTNPLKCTSSDVEKAYPTDTNFIYFMYCSSINMQIVKLRKI